jgi:hypothetical protein
MKYLFILFIFISLVACNDDKKDSATNEVSIKEYTPINELKIDFIKDNSLGEKGVYDLNKIDLNKLVPVDSNTLSGLPEMYQQVYADDYLYFYDFSEHNTFDLLTLINGNQFGDFLDIFVISKESKSIIADTNIVLSGSEDVWEGQSKGLLVDDYFQIEMINQVDSVGYSDVEFVRKIDTVIYRLIPSSTNFQVKIQDTKTKIETIVIKD